MMQRSKLMLAAMLVSTLVGQITSAYATGNTAELTYPALQPLEGLSDPSLAFGLNGVSDWSSATPFLNLMKQSRYWVGHQQDKWGGVGYDELKAGGYLDENGYVTHMPSGVIAIGTIWAWSEKNDGAGEDRKGRYVLTYDGEGAMTFIGVEIVSQEPGRIVLDNKTGRWFSMDITKTDPKGTGNYLRNMAIVREDYLPLYEAGAIFNPEWLALIKDARQIRFMDMMYTNGSKIRKWDDFNKKNGASWAAEGGVPVEVMVALANQIGADPWFTMPFHADDDLIRKFATYVRDHLDPKLVAHVELSNEVWNFVFQQTQDALALAKQKYGDDAGDSAWLSYYGERASHVMAIWTDVFGASADARLKRIAGSFTEVQWYTEQILTAPIWQQADPANYVAPHTYFDAVAITSYFGVSIVLDEDQRNKYVATVKDPSIDNDNWLRDFIRPAMDDAAKRYQEHAELARKYGLDLMLYEGGQHVHHSAFVEADKETLQLLQDHLAGFVRSPQMAELYAASWDLWRQHGDGPYMQYVDVGVPNQYGSWGLYATFHDTTPRATFLEDKNRTITAWWESRGGAHFQQGRVVKGNSANDTLAGTPAEDFLLGGDGDDVLYPGPGDDGVNGGAGEDIVMLRGKSSAYSVTSEDGGYRIVGPDGSDYVYAVESLYFEDGTTRSLSSGASKGNAPDAR